jgi:hypothetical protein
MKRDELEIYHKYCKQLMVDNPKLSFGDAYYKTILFAIQKSRKETLEQVEKVIDEYFPNKNYENDWKIIELKQKLEKLKHGTNN